MEYYNKILCVTWDDLTGGEQPVTTAGALNKMVTRSRVEVARRGGGEGNCTLIVYSSLPKKYRERWEQLNGKPEDKMRREDEKVALRMDAEARAWYEGYTYLLNGQPTTLPQELVEEYTLNASVLNDLAARRKELESLTRRLNNPKRDVWGVLQLRCESLRTMYGHTLPGNLSRLKEKASAYARDGYRALLSGKLGNSNTLKLTPEAQQQVIAWKRCRVPVMTDTQILEAYNAMAPERGWKPLRSVRSLTEWLATPAVEPLWWDAVYGEQSSRQRYNRQHKTALPQRRDSLWYGDGTKLNLYYRDGEGRVRTMQVYEVVDAYSEVLLGFHISETEDYEAQYHAYRMAVQVSGHKPYEIVHDNQGGHKRANSAGMLDRICRVHRTTAPYNGQSKTIENIFSRFQQQVLHQDWRFTGQNITAKRLSSRANLEFVEENSDRLYTLNELKAAYVEARMQWNRMPHPATGVSRMEMYQASVNEETPEVTALDMIDMFWVMTERPSTFTAGGIEITVKRKKYTYEVYSAPGVPDHEWRRTHTREQFYVKYDPYDFGSVRLYRKDRAGGLRFERVAQPYMVVHRALQEQQAGEAAFIRREQAAAVEERIVRQVAAKQIEYAHGVAPEQHGLSTPSLKGLTAEQQREADRRTRKYSREPEELQLGRYTKVTSNLTLDQVDGTIHFDQRKAAGKL